MWCVCGGDCSCGVSVVETAYVTVSVVETAYVTVSVVETAHVVCADGSKSPLYRMDPRLSQLQHELDSQNPSKKEAGGVVHPVLLFCWTSTILRILVKCQIVLVLVFLSMILQSSLAALSLTLHQYSILFSLSCSRLFHHHLSVQHYTVAFS